MTPASLIKVYAGWWVKVISEENSFSIKAYSDSMLNLKQFAHRLSDFFQ